MPLMPTSEAVPVARSARKLFVEAPLVGMSLINASPSVTLVSEMPTAPPGEAVGGGEAVSVRTGC
jgi:hypothetical protein